MLAEVGPSSASCLDHIKRPASQDGKAAPSNSVEFFPSDVRPFSEWKWISTFRG